jgi:uncharacterized OB-fold protein
MLNQVQFRNESSRADAPVRIVDGAARLVAGACRECETQIFPVRPRCPSCGSSDLAETLLPERGALWTWTTQGFEPKSPPYVPDGDFVPFAVGYVEFEGHLRVEGRLTESDPNRLRIGMPMRVVAVDLAGVASYAFAPDEDAA